MLIHSKSSNWENSPPLDPCRQLHGIESPLLQTLQRGRWSAEATWHSIKVHEGSTVSSWWFQPICKNMSQIGILPQVGMKIKNIWNHQLGLRLMDTIFIWLAGSLFWWHNPFKIMMYPLYMCSAGEWLVTVYLLMVTRPMPLPLHPNHLNRIQDTPMISHVLPPTFN